MAGTNFNAQGTIFNSGLVFVLFFVIVVLGRPNCKIISNFAKRRGQFTCPNLNSKRIRKEILYLTTHSTHFIYG